MSRSKTFNFLVSYRHAFFHAYEAPEINQTTSFICQSAVFDGWYVKNKGFKSHALLILNKRKQYSEIILTAA